MSQFAQIRKCDVCESEDLDLVLDLGLHPLCDDLVPVSDSRVCRKYPIEILYCKVCRTAHQRYRVPKTDLFPTKYHYRARFTADVVEGMAGLVEACEERFGPLSGKSVLDIGCNDGSLLNLFRKKGATTIGVEPTDAHRDAEEGGHMVFPDFLSEATAYSIVGAHGRPDFITFTNVFAHVDSLRETIKALRILSGEQTVIVIENHYLGAVLGGEQFDTFYHEHARTYSRSSFLHIARALGKALIATDFPRRYGGNIRVFLGSGPGTTGDEVANGLDAKEERFGDRFESLRSNMECWRAVKRRTLRDQVRQFGPLPAKAFPGRAAILIGLLGLDEESISAVYEKPGSLKIGHYVPGTRIPIRSDTELFERSDSVFTLLNLAWHISGEIRSYLSQHGYAGPVMDILSPEDFSSAAAM